MIERFASRTIWAVIQVNKFMHASWLHRFSVLLAVATLLLVAAGASVVSKEAGLSVPDWPLSYGQVMPEMKGGVLYEHGHRMIASAVGFMTIILTVWIWRTDDRRWLRQLALAALGAVIVQGVLGGLTVLYLLPKAVSISHACLAQLFFAATMAIALFTSPSWKQGPRIVEDGGWPSLRSLAWITPVAVLAQLALGAGYRHKAFGLMPHAIWAFVVALLICLWSMFVLTQFKDHLDLRRWAKWLIALTGAQVVLGLVAYVVRLTDAANAAPGTWMVVVTVAHVALGALVMGSTVATSIQVLRNVRTVRHSSPARDRELTSPGRAS